jgi:lipopolysaccharide/colanic/teichoic acid biosynthesis glycosyltransferase
MAFPKPALPPAPELIPLANARPARKRKAAKTPAFPAPPRPLNRRYLPWKAALEFTAAVVLAVLALPVVTLCALLVKLTSRGPAFYTQVRLGRGGRPFTILKLRTMIHECESLTGPRWAIRGDPRVTAIGQMLRITHLDELPQLLNVLRGDMALIGPRPERPEFVHQLERALPDYHRRMAVRPGVTGLAQVQLGADTDVASVRRKLCYDLYYIDRIGLWLDARVAAATVLYALGDPLQLTRRLRLVPGREVVEGAGPRARPAPTPPSERVAA